MVKRPDPYAPHRPYCRHDYDALADLTAQLDIAAAASAAASALTANEQRARARARARSQSIVSEEDSARSASRRRSGAGAGAAARRWSSEDLSRHAPADSDDDDDDSAEERADGDDGADDGDDDDDAYGESSAEGVAVALCEAVDEVRRAATTGSARRKSRPALTHITSCPACDRRVTAV